MICEWISWRKGRGGQQLTGIICWLPGGRDGKRIPFSFFKILSSVGERRTFHPPTKKGSRQEGGVQVPEVRVGSGGASLCSYFPTPISITCAVWTTGATSLWKQLWEKGSVGDLEVLERKGTKKWSPRNLPVFLILAIHFSLATWSRPM